MIKQWQGLALVAALALGTGTGCRLLMALAKKPKATVTIGTRTGMNSKTLAAKEKAKSGSAKYIGCDIAYENIPTATKMTYQWRKYHDKDAAKEGDTSDKTDEKWELVTGTGTFMLTVGDNGTDMEDAIYECHVKFEKDFDGNELNGRLTVGDVAESGSKKKKKGGDDDGDKKKKKKGSDDD
ncbi:MAG: hypothetical protein JNL79_28680 [Myxococcales bacterium]|nr:hypothetical protein [Myxococcales bacterium]